MSLFRLQSTVIPEASSEVEFWFFTDPKFQIKSMVRFRVWLGLGKCTAGR